MQLLLLHAHKIMNKFWLLIALQLLLYGDLLFFVITHSWFWSLLIIRTQESVCLKFPFPSASPKVRTIFCRDDLRKRNLIPMWTWQLWFKGLKYLFDSVVCIGTFFVNFILQSRHLCGFSSLIIAFTNREKFLNKTPN